MAMALSYRLKFLFCQHSNTSQATECSSCGAPTLPTRDPDGRRITWAFSAFGSTAPSAMRNSGIHFNDSVAALDAGQRAAVYVGNQARRVLLIQIPNTPWKFSVKIGAEDGVLPITRDWASDESDENRVLFHRIVREILDADDMRSGRSELQSLLLHFYLLTVNCDIGTFSWGEI